MAKKLWIVTVENWNYDGLTSAAVWAKDEDKAVKIVCESGEPLPSLPVFKVEPAPRSGMVLGETITG